MRANWKDYLELTKPRIVSLVLVTATIGYYLGGNGIRSWEGLVFLLLGVGLVASGSAVLNHYIERDYDLKMKRTQKRPIPDGRIKPAHAFPYGVGLTLLGIVLLYIKINILVSFLSLLTTFLYVLVYTPMKRVSWWNTSIGAFPGAMPILGGWAAATGTLNFHAGILFLILFLWQHPHFYAIAWMCREDYKKAGFRMLPCLEEDGKRTFQQIKWTALLLIPVSMMPSLTGLSGKIYLFGVLLAGLILYRYCAIFIKTKSMADARTLLRATVLYLPVLLTLIVFDVHV